ncbi:MAG: hypothetical protein HKN27_13710, partial [Silicimonas sp.]|nr:hypothetical protein [Silicimonas sp.]
NPTRAEKWLFTWGIAGGLIGALLSLLALLVFGVTAGTLSALIVSGTLIAVAVWVYPAKSGGGG